MNQQDLCENNRYLVACPICNKHFKSSPCLKRHTKVVHEGYRPFACECGKDFATKEQLTRHRNSKHTHEKPYLCEKGCHKSFASYTAREYHHKVHHDLVKFSCPIFSCLKQYSSKIQLKAHMKKPHLENVLYQYLQTLLYYYIAGRMYPLFPGYN